MIPAVIIALITEALKLVNLLLEGTPVEQRRAQSIAWFWLTWPIGKPILKATGMPAEAIAKMEDLMKQAESVNATKNATPQPKGTP